MNTMSPRDNISHMVPYYSSPMTPSYIYTQTSQKRRTCGPQSTPVLCSKNSASPLVAKHIQFGDYSPAPSIDVLSDEHLIASLNGQQPDFVTIDSPDSLENWFQSATHSALDK